MKSTIKDVTAYIQQFDKDKQAILNTLRSLIFQTVPQAEEKLSWSVPTYYLNGYLIQFAAYERHLGFYSSPAARVCLTAFPLIIKIQFSLIIKNRCLLI